MVRKTLLFIAVFMSLFGVEVQAGHWPHWRGPFLNGSADEKNLPGTLSLAENVMWTKTLPGHSSATPIICKGRVFVSSTDKESNDLLGLCFDVTTGKELWRKKLGTATRTVRRNNMATPSPVTDESKVCFMYGTGELACLNYDGDIIWTRNIEADYGNISTNWGYSSSPLIYNGKLYILVQRGASMFRREGQNSKGVELPEPFMLVIDPKTGKNIWKQPRKTDAIAEALDAYSTPIAFENNGRTEIVVIGLGNFSSQFFCVFTQVNRNRFDSLRPPAENKFSRSDQGIAKLAMCDNNNTEHKSSCKHKVGGFGPIGRRPLLMLC